MWGRGTERDGVGWRHDTTTLPGYYKWPGTGRFGSVHEKLIRDDPVSKSTRQTTLHTLWVSSF